jgi:hypothetical protein
MSGIKLDVAYVELEPYNQETNNSFSGFVRSRTIFCSARG